MAFLKWIFALPFIIAAVAFAIANPDTVSLTWSPLNNKIIMPLYAVILIFMGLGFFLGSVVTWLGMGKIRKERRYLKRENKKLEKAINKEEESKKTIIKNKNKNDPLIGIIEKENKNIEKLS